MEVALKVNNSEFSIGDIRRTIADALANQLEEARQRRDYYQSRCAAFEQAHSLSSTEFSAKFASGELGDDAEWFDWLAALRAFEHWDRRFRILSEISV